MDNFDLDSILAEFASAERSEPDYSENDATKRIPVEPAKSVYKKPAAPAAAPERQPHRSPEREHREIRKPEFRDSGRPQRPVPPDNRNIRREPDPVSAGGIRFIGILLTMLCLAFSLVVIHPASGSSSAAVSALKTGSIASEIGAYADVTAERVLSARQLAATQEAEQQAAAAAAAAVVPEPVRYTIPETALAAPVPDPASYGSVMPDNAGEILNVIRRAEEYGLLQGQNTIFSTDIDFRTDTAIRYYLDETLLVLCWKEIIDGNTCSCVEVKTADPSQFRRKFADDAFGAANTYYATDLSRSVNSVVSMNADFYLFRDFGIVVQNRELYRFNENVYTGQYKKYNCVDTCFVTADGDFLYFKRGQETTEEDIRQFIADNDIMFSIAFGPVLVENSEAQVIDWYPVGEIDKGYSRAGIGQVDDLHYFYMSLNHSNEKQARWDINTFARHFAEKGVENGYALDGGQTSEIVFQGEPYNYIDFGAERLVSDIIYFATAVPSGEVSG